MLLPQNVCRKLESIRLQSNPVQRDLPTWTSNSNGLFMIASGISLSRPQQMESVQDLAPDLEFTS